MSKDVRKIREFEEALIANYHAYLNVLEELLNGLFELSSIVFQKCFQWLLAMSSLHLQKFFNHLILQFLVPEHFGNDKSEKLEYLRREDAVEINKLIDQNSRRREIYIFTKVNCTTRTYFVTKSKLTQLFQRSIYREQSENLSAIDLLLLLLL